MMFILPKTKKVGGWGGICLPQLWRKVVTNICLTYFHQRQCAMSSDSVSKALQESRYFTAVKREGGYRNKKEPISKMTYFLSNMMTVC